MSAIHARALSVLFSVEIFVFSFNSMDDVIVMFCIVLYCIELCIMCGNISLLFIAVFYRPIRSKGCLFFHGSK
jgi:hypothetical protein